MKVKAPPGILCPKEEQPREYITEDPAGVEVPDSAYYRRLVDDGSLLTISIEAPAKNKGGDQ